MSTLIGNEQGLQFEFSMRTDVSNTLGWGAGRLFFQGEIVWFSDNGDEAERAPIEWTWVEFLAYLGKWWPWITLEEDYPLDINPLHPGTFLIDAEKRWEDLSDLQVDEEEEEARRFMIRHDIAESFSGLFVPSVVFLKQGNNAQIWADSLRRLIVQPFVDFEKTLEEVGEFLADNIRGSVNPQDEQALDLWDRRGARKDERALDIKTGLSAVERQAAIEDGLPAGKWHEEEIQLVARMSRGAVSNSDRTTLLKLISQQRFVETNELDRITRYLKEIFSGEGRPFEQGYELARLARQYWNLQPSEKFDPQEKISSWGVPIVEIDYLEEDCSVKALAAWGPSYGPVVVLNTRDQHVYGLRATLAHEIAHLLIDRNGALPAGEVFGGRAPEFVEKRARAFSAEILIPREVVAQSFKNIPTLEALREKLQAEFCVSREMLAWQVTNSSARETLSKEDREVLERWKKPFISLPK